MAALAALLVEPHLDTAFVAELPEPAEQLVSGHAPLNRTFLSYCQARNGTFSSLRRTA